MFASSPSRNRTPCLSVPARCPALPRPSPDSMTTISPSISRIPSLTSPPAQNPISLRLYKVLSANFDDDATREALDTLAELYAPSTSAGGSGQGVNGKGKEVKLDGRHEGDVEDEVEGVPGAKANGLVAAATVDEGTPGDIAARARKNLRRDVESKLAESSRQFLTAFGEVDKVCRGAGYLRPGRCSYYHQNANIATGYTAGAYRPDAHTV